MIKPPVFKSAWLAYSDTTRAMRAMPVLVLVAVSVSIADALVYRIFDLSSSDVETGKTLLIRLVLGVAEAILLTPVFIAIHRYIILDEVTRDYALDTNNRRFQVFCAWAVAIFLLVEFPSSIASVIKPEELATGMTIVLLVTGFVVTIYLTLLFPAIAVDAPGATLQNAIADRRGSFWRIWGILVLTLLPVMAVPAAISTVTDDTSIMMTVAGSLAASYFGLLWTAASARLFQALADGLRSPA